MDIAILRTLQSWRVPALDALFQLATYLGEEVLLIAALCFVYWCLNKRLAQYVLFNLLVAGWLNAALKVTFCVPRPWVRDPSIVPVASARRAASGFSFPSGHTAAAVAAYGALAARLGRRWATAAACAIIALVGFSRLYLGVHAPQDVLMSLLVGAGLLWAMERLLGALDRDPGLERAVFWTGLLLSAALMVYARLKPYPDADGVPKLVLDTFKQGGAAAGMLLGWRFERRFVRFDERAPAGWQVAKYALGMAAVGAALALKPPAAWIDGRIWAMGQYLLLAFTALGLWPLAFSRFLRARGVGAA